MKNGATNQFKLSTAAKDALSKQFKFYYSKIFTMKQELKERVEGMSGGEIPLDNEEESEIARELSIIEHNALESKERHQYYYILRAIDSQTLKQWSSEVVRKYHENFQQAELKRKSKSSSIWNVFSWASGSAEEEKGEIDQSNHEFASEKADFHISEEEIKEINNIVQHAIEDSEDEIQDDSSLHFKIEYKCLKGEINVEDDWEISKSGILFKYTKWWFDMKKMVSREFMFTTSMKDLTVDVFFEMPHKAKLIHLPLFRSKERLFENKNQKVVQKDNQDELEEEIYQVTIFRNKAGSVVDLEFFFTIKPIYFYYRSILEKIIKSFTSLGARSSEELRLNAWDKFQDIKDNTQEKIQSALLKTTNILNGQIQDPKLVLPFIQNNDLNNPAYVLCLGNLEIIADKENLNEPMYEYLKIAIKGTQFQYFESMHLWYRYEKDSLRVSLAGDEIFNGLNSSVFNVIEELEMYFKIGKLKEKHAVTADFEKSAQFVFEGNVSDIRVNMTSERYNNLINFSKMIEISSRDFTSKILLHEKEDIINMAAKTGFLRKRGDTLQYWNRQYAVLSGSYLYFYPEDIENAEGYESWMYIKDAVVEIYKEKEEDMTNVFYISNNNKSIFLYVQDEENMREWIKELRERIYEIANMTENFENQNKIGDSVNYEALKNLDISKLPEIKFLEINLVFENVEYNMINDDYSRFLKFRINEMSLSAKATTIGYRPNNEGKIKSIDNKYSQYILVGIKKINIDDIQNNLSLLESINDIKIGVNVLNNHSKAYEGDNLVLKFEFDIVNIKFLPKSIKKMITFFKRTGFEEDNKEEVIIERANSKIEERKEEDMHTTAKRFETETSKTKRPEKLLKSNASDLKNSEHVMEAKNSQLHEDNYNNVLVGKSIMKIHLSFKRTLIALINPYQMKPFVYLEANQLLPYYELKQGYHALNLQ